MNEQDLPALRTQARRLLAALRTEFDRTAAALARVCAVDGRLEAARLDERQFASYALALAGADLLAAETAVGASGLADATNGESAQQDAATDGALSAFDLRLALTYAADAIE